MSRLSSPLIAVSLILASVSVAAAQPGDAPVEEPGGFDDGAPPDGGLEDGGGVPATGGEAAAARDKDAYLAFLASKIDEVQGQVLDGLMTKIAQKNDDRFGLIVSILLALSAAGLLLLLLPLYLRRRYPGRTRELLRLSATAAVMFVVTMVVFSLLLVVFKGFQAELGTFTNPQVQLTNAAFEALEENLEELGDPTVIQLLVEAPLAQILDGTAEDVPSALLVNASAFKADFTAFKSIASAFSWVKGILGLLPVFLSLLVVGLFLLTQKDIIRTIVTMPERVASGQATSGEVVRLVRRRLVGEAITTLVLLGVLTVLMILTTISMVLVAQPSADALMGYLMINQIYVFSVPDASTALVYISLGSTLLFIVLALVSLVVGVAFLLGKWQKVLRARFAYGVPLRSHKRFLGRGALAFLWILAFPLLFITGAEAVVDALLSSQMSGTDVSWGGILASGPLILILGFLGFYWLLRGFRAQRYLLKYKVEAPTAAPAEAT